MTCSFMRVARLQFETRLQKCIRMGITIFKIFVGELELEDLDLILRERRLRWFGHVERSSGAIRTACDIQIDGRRGQGGLS